VVKSLWAHTDEEYAVVAVHLPEHPEHEEFLKVFADPIFHEPFVDLSCLALPSSAPLPLPHQDGRSPIRFVDFCESHGLDATQTRVVMGLLNELKDVFTGLLGLPARNSAQCPAAYLAEHIGRGTDADSAGLHESFVAYLIGHRERLSSRTYAELCAELEQKARHSIMEVLNESQLQSFADSPAQGLLDIDTGYDPFGESIARRVGDLATRTDVGTRGRLLREWRRWWLVVTKVTVVRIGERRLGHAWHGKVLLPWTFRVRFMDYLASHRKRASSSRTYAELCTEVDKQTRQLILAILNEPQRRRFTGGPEQGLPDIDTGYDRFGESIVRQLTKKEFEVEGSWWFR
jgi:hypothetical protein